MGLSEEESRIFDTLVEEIKAPERSNITDIQTRKIVLHAVLFIVSVALMIFSVTIKQPLLGIVCFALMVYSVNTLVKLSRFGRYDKFIE